MQQLWSGVLKKMNVAAATPVEYRLVDAADRDADGIGLNAYLDHDLRLEFSGARFCVACGREVKKLFNQGFCFPCSRSRAEADICIVRPELCHFDDAEHPCRDADFAASVCFQPHVLYCSLTSGVKVGITRRPHIPDRWIDQGAVSAIPVAELPSRREVGLVEKRLVDAGYQDKTHWTRMLKGDPDPELQAGLDDLVSRAVDQLRQWGIEGILAAGERRRHDFTYPVLEHPTKVKSFNLDKDPVVAGRLRGIKGQYLIFAEGVINVRKFTGYKVRLGARNGG